MKSTPGKILAVLLATVLFSINGLNAAEGARPNIILILADDLGYSDIGCFGSEISTPNLDRLAKRGVALTQFYNQARCCPTWAALLDGWMQGQGDQDKIYGDPTLLNSPAPAKDGEAE